MIKKSTYKSEIPLTEEENSILEEYDFDKNVIAQIKDEIKSNFVKNTETSDKIITFEIDEIDVYSLSMMQRKYKQYDYFVFRSEQDKLSVIKTNSKFDILRVMNTDGINYDITNEDVINKLQEWNKKYPFAILGATSESVEINFYDYIYETGDSGEFAQELYKFCPDIVEQGVESVENLEEMLDETTYCFLWWD